MRASSSESYAMACYRIRTGRDRMKNKRGAAAGLIGEFEASCARCPGRNLETVCGDRGFMSGHLLRMPGSGQRLVKQGAPCAPRVRLADVALLAMGIR